MICFFGGLFVAGATITFWTVEFDRGDQYIHLRRQ